MVKLGKATPLSLGRLPKKDILAQLSTATQIPSPTLTQRRTQGSIPIPTRNDTKIYGIKKIIIYIEGSNCDHDMLVKGCHSYQ
jgi:hypothetical protein